jgi:hypothetical protein
MEFDVSTLLNYGAIGLCLAYFIYKDNATMKSFRETLEELKETILILKERVGGK